MPRRKSEKQLKKIEAGRKMSVMKRDDMIQNSRYTLTVQEQRCVLYAISKIKGEDSAFTEYTFDIKDFYALCGLEDQSYTRLKQILIGLKSKSWWVEIDDKGTESAVSWFNTVRTNKRSGKVTIKFHEDMMPFLLQVAQQNAFFTTYNLQFVLPMRGQYSPRLYEILKSYAKNNREWFFEIDDLKQRLDCTSYKNFNDFRRFVLDPAVQEINDFSDLSCTYDVEREGRKIVRVIFYMVHKRREELQEAKIAGIRRMDGQLDFFDLYVQPGSGVKQEFFRQHPGADFEEEEI